jgi:hypothetical protein
LNLDLWVMRSEASQGGQPTGQERRDESDAPGVCSPRCD